jgi:hypothetical protein
MIPGHPVIALTMEQVPANPLFRQLSAPGIRDRQSHHPGALGKAYREFHRTNVRYLSKEIGP